MKGREEGKFIAKDGHVLDSEFEKEVDNRLFENGYPHEIHPKYPGPRRFVADFRILRTDAYIEAVGMGDVKEYREELKRKRNYADNREMKLIEIVPADLETKFSSLGKLIKDRLDEVSQKYPELGEYRKIAEKNSRIRKITKKIGELRKKRESLDNKIAELSVEKNRILTESVRKRMDK